MIRDDIIGESVILEKVSKVNVCGLFCCNIGVDGDEVSHLGEPVYTQVNHIVSLKLRQLHYEIHQHRLPWSQGNGKGV